MPDELTFSMGNYAARIPVDRHYSKNHLWLQKTSDAYRVGFTAYSVRLLQDVYFLEWSIDPGMMVRAKQPIGEIESSKALSTLYSPFDGRIVEFNEQLLSDPSAINTDAYGKGWLYTIETTAMMLEPESYVQLLTAGWEETQRLIKGQINEG